jgi:hypothetical protein
MIKKWSFYTSLTIIIAFLSSGFKPFDLDSNRWFLATDTDGEHYMYPSQKQNDYIDSNVPFTGKFFIGYKEAIGFKESQGQYKKINTIGCMGKYQFGMETLRSVGINNSSSFLNSPNLQEKAFVALLAKNKWELKDVIEKYDGTVLNGIKITESGILAAAHLGGVGSVKKYFRSNGKRYIRDTYGTSIRSYMRTFGGFDTSFIVADSDANVY